MWQHYLSRILVIVVALNVFALGVLLVFLVNFRINIRRRVLEREFALRLLVAVQKSASTEEVARHTGLPVSDVSEYCRVRGIETPEERTSRLELIRQRKEEEARRIMEEEALWRSEQERITAERQREKEQEAKRRRERMKKFGVV